jgi:hypothetical protein
VETGRTIREWAAKVLTVLLPGGGQLAVGRPLSGLVVTLPASLVVAGVVLSEGFLRNPGLVPALPGFTVVVGVVAVILYALSLLDTLRG